MSRRASTATAGLLLAVVLLAFVLLMLPRLLEQTAISAGTPVPLGSRAETRLALAAGRQVCESDVTIDTAPGRATIAAGPAGRAPLPALQLSLTAPGYREQVRLPGGASALMPLSAAISGPDRPVVGTACVRNPGTRPVVLLATGDPRVLTRTHASTDGREQPAAFSLAFEEARPARPLAKLPELIDRAAIFSAVGPWLYWLLLPLVVVGVPLAVAAAFLLALRTPDAAVTDDR